MKTNKYYYMKRLLLICFCSIFIFINSYSQNGAAINTTGATADSSAILDVSSSEKGVLFPRMTESEKNNISNPAFGLLIFNKTTGCFNLWTGTSWRKICGECDFSAPVAQSTSPVCEGESLILTTSFILGATYNWTGPNNFSSNNQNPIINNVTLQADGMYAVTATVNGCTSNPSTTYVSIKPKPQTPIVSNDSPKCFGNSINLNANNINGAIYSWNGPNNFSSNLQNPIIPDIQLSDTGYYSVFVSVNSCNSDTAYTYINVLTTPNDIPFIAGETSPCEGTQDVIYSVNYETGVTYNWTVPSGYTITEGQGTDSIKVNIGSSTGDVIVVPSNTCGNGLQQSLTVSPVLFASGGTITTIPGYRIHTFTTDGSFIVSSDCNDMNVEVLVVGGGGGGGINHSGAGGGGGVVYNNSISLMAGQVVNVAIGEGGQGATNSTSFYQGEKGGDSQFGILIAYGGGGGGSRHDGAAPGQGNGGNGGCGGGGGGRDAGDPDYLGGSGTVGQGYNGGNGYRASYPASGGGGGGAGAAGAHASSYRGGNGGSGIANSITGTSTYYGGGGGGGSYGPNGGIAGTGGAGGGGNGSANTINASDGATNTGGGGGGAGPQSQPGSGGSGIVIVKYSIP